MNCFTHLPGRASGLALLVLAVGCQVQPAKQTVPWVPIAPASSEAADTPENEAARQKLAQHVSVDFEKARLDAALEFLRKETGVNLDVQWPALAEVQVTSETPVVLKLADVPAEGALKRVLAQVSTVPDNPVIYGITEGILTVSTAKTISLVTDIRVYDVGDLLAVPEEGWIDWKHISALYPFQRQPNQGPGGLETNRTVRTCMVDLGPPPSVEKRIDRLMYLINSTVGSPEDWAGYAGNMQLFNSQLFVRTSSNSHRQLVQLLKELRRQLQTNIAAELRHEAVIELLAKADALRHQQHYDAAMKIADEALAIDPHHPWARAMKKVLEERKK